MSKVRETISLGSKAGKYFLPIADGKEKILNYVYQFSSLKTIPNKEPLKLLIPAKAGIHVFFS